jgi:hypothetical protein
VAVSTKKSVSDDVTYPKYFITCILYLYLATSCNSSPGCCATIATIYNSWNWKQTFKQLTDKKRERKSKNNYDSCICGTISYCGKINRDKKVFKK